MQGVVKRWGNSAAVRIPASVLAAAKLGVDQFIDVREEAGRIIIEPIERYELGTLVSGITDENRHDPIDTGPSTGNEIW